MPLRSRFKSLFRDPAKKTDTSQLLGGSATTDTRDQFPPAIANNNPSALFSGITGLSTGGVLPKDAGFITNPNNVLIRDSSLINVEQLTQIIQSGSTVLHLLDGKRTRGAEVDSSERDDPPRCHPNTREQVRQKIKTWRSDPQRDHSMLWLLGPAGVGKSAIAQTIAEECAADGSLGATFFFSRLNNRNDPNSVIPTIVYQLVVRYPDYKKLITQLLATNPSLLEKNLRTQFKELIIEPFKVLMMHGPLLSQRPLVVIIDGLDECNGRKAQCEFIHLISEHIRLTRPFPLIWMVCSRPEWHLKSVLADADFYIDCVREELSVDDAKAQQDVYRYLQSGFKEIRKTFLYMLDDSWPLETDVRRIAKKASGLFIFASTLLKFIGDPDRCNPKVRLEVCLEFIEGLQAFEGVNPLHFLDLLYHQILSDVPSDILPTSMRILGLCILYPTHQLSVRGLANFLGLDQSSFYAALQWFHSVMHIPAPRAADKDNIRFHHASFGDFLKNSSRSGKFALDQAKSHYEVAMNCLRWYASAVEMDCQLEPGQCVCRSRFMKLSWAPDFLHSPDGKFGVHSFALRTCWIACPYVQDPYIASVLAEVRLFPFCHLGQRSYGLTNAIYWLSQVSQDPLLLRQAAESDEDRLILAKYQDNGGVVSFEASFDVRSSGYMACWSLHHPSQEFLSLTKQKRCVLMGSGGHACLVVLARN